MVSMDGPSVNCAFYEKLQQKVKTEFNCQLLNIVAFILCTERLSTAAMRRSGTSRVSSAPFTLFSMKHQLAERIIHGSQAVIYSHATSAIPAGLRMCLWLSACWRFGHTSSYVVSAAASDPLFTVRLNCFTSVAKVITPYVRSLHSIKPISRSHAQAPTVPFHEA